MNGESDPDQTQQGRWFQSWKTQKHFQTAEPQPPWTSAEVCVRLMCFPLTWQQSQTVREELNPPPRADVHLMRRRAQHPSRKTVMYDGSHGNAQRCSGELPAPPGVPPSALWICIILPSDHGSQMKFLDTDVEQQLLMSLTWKKTSLWTGCFDGLNVIVLLPASLIPGGPFPGEESRNRAVVLLLHSAFPARLCQEAPTIWAAASFLSAGSRSAASAWTQTDAVLFFLRCLKNSNKEDVS